MAHSLPAINGNSLFWVMAAFIAGEFIVIFKLAGALHRSRHPGMVVQGTAPGTASEVARGRDPGRDDARPPARRRRGGRGRLAAGAAVLVAVALAVDKVAHFSHPGTSAPSPATTAKPPVPVTGPAPKPVPAHPVPTAPNPVTHAVTHWLSGTDLMVVLIIAILVAGAIGINRVRARTAVS